MATSIDKVESSPFSKQKTINMEGEEMGERGEICQKGEEKENSPEHSDMPDISQASSRSSMFIIQNSSNPEKQVPDDDKFSAPQKRLMEKWDIIKMKVDEDKQLNHQTRKTMIQSYYHALHNFEEEKESVLKMIKKPCESGNKEIVDETLLKKLALQMMSKLKGVIVGEKEERIIEQVIRIRSTCALAKLPYFSKENYKQLSKLLQESRQFGMWFTYGNQDFEALSTSFSNKLIEFLNYSPLICANIYRELMQDPMSNVVASSEDLTSKQKFRFYHEMMGHLKTYAEVLHFKNSKEALITKEVEKIVDYLNQQIVNIAHLVDKIRDFQFEVVLDDQLISGIMKTLYFFAKDNCPVFFEKFLRSKFSAHEELKSDNLIQLTFQLRQKFIEIELIPQDWQQIEKNILKKNYSCIDNLRSSSVGKNKLWMFVIEKIETYFFYEENKMSIENKLKCLILDILIDQNDPDERKSFRRIFSLTEEKAKLMIKQKSPKCLEVESETYKKLGISVKDLEMLIKDCSKNVRKEFEDIKKFKMIRYESMLKEEKYFESQKVDDMVNTFVKNNFKTPQNLQKNSFSVPIVQKEIVSSVMEKEVKPEVNNPPDFDISKIEQNVNEALDRDPIIENILKQSEKEECQNSSSEDVGKNAIEDLKGRLKACGRDTMMKTILKSKNKLSQEQRDKEEFDIYEAILKGTIEEKKVLFKGNQMTKLQEEMKTAEAIGVLQEIRHMYTQR